MVELDPTKTGPRDFYKVMISAIVPRPIAWVSTISPEGIINVAPFSFFNGVSSEPPCLMISITTKRGSKNGVVLKDTLKNIELTKEFVVHASMVSLAEEINATSAPLDYNVSEINNLGLKVVESVKIKTPRIAKAAWAFECRLYNTLQVGKDSAGSATIVVGEIVYAHISKDVFQNGSIQAERVWPLARLGGNYYSELGRIFELERPKNLGATP